MNKRLGQEGGAKAILVIVILVFAAYVGIEFGKPQFRYRSLESRSKDILAVDTEPEVVKRKVLAEAKDLNVPLKEDALEVITKDNKMLKVVAKWSETVDFWGFYQQKFDFDMSAEL